MATLINNLFDFPPELRGGGVAVGNFDGVHCGHAALIAELRRKACQVQGPSVVVTFDPPPVAILVPDRPPSSPLTTLKRRAELLGGLGVDALVAIPTDRTLLSMTPHEFFHQIILDQLGAKAMVEGPNFHFGKDRGGDTQLLGELCRQAGIELSIVAPTTHAGDMISSTKIRDLLTEGRVGDANRLLLQPYQLGGIVAKGSQRGRLLGFPTANLEGVSCLIPGHGVYAALAEINGSSYAAALHIGPNPTFGETQSKVEVHVIDWTGNLYGEHLECKILERVRGTQKFESSHALKTQLELDIQNCTFVAQEFKHPANPADKPHDSLP